MKGKGIVYRGLAILTLTAILQMGAESPVSAEQISIQGDWLEAGDQGQFTSVFSFGDYGRYCYWYLDTEKKIPFYKLYPGTYTIEGNVIHLKDESGGLAVETVTIKLEEDGIHLYSDKDKYVRGTP